MKGPDGDRGPDLDPGGYYLDLNKNPLSPRIRHMKASELRQKFLNYFESKGHRIIPSSLVTPENDPTVLFTTAGMHPLVPYLLGQRHPEGNRLASVQKCIRTDDIEEVGDGVHHTFFEMLGNWSLGDYFKKEAIEYSWEFLTAKQYLGLAGDKIAVSVFAGDENAPFDEESYNVWLALGLAPERVAKLDKKDNWWGPAGQTGPCGPDTEMFYWSDKAKPPKKFDPEDKRWVEIWNNVFMEFNKKEDGTFEPLAQKNVDTGMGLERTLAVLAGQDDDYKTELFLPLIKKIEAITGFGYQEFLFEYRIIADHVKAAVFAIADGVVPSNKEAGYVIRRLIRRAIIKGNAVGIEKNFLEDLSEAVIEIYRDAYPVLLNRKDIVQTDLHLEEEKFRKTLKMGLRVFDRIASERASISGKEAFDLYQSYGFPFEMTQEMATDRNITVDEKEYREEFRKHQELSRTASTGMFKGGLADYSEATTKLHTAAHLLHAALRQVLGEEALQKGSNITAERLRFDFAHDTKLTVEELQKVEDLVNAKIQEKIPVEKTDMTPDMAKKEGALGIFDHKYGDQISVYTIGNFSKEICGGPHVDNTGELGKFAIIKEESSSKGVRRIKAVLS